MHHRNEDAEQTKHQKEKKCSLESSYLEAALPLPFFPFHSMHLLFLESPAVWFFLYISHGHTYLWWFLLYSYPISVFCSSWTGRNKGSERWSVEREDWGWEIKKTKAMVWTRRSRISWWPIPSKFIKYSILHSIYRGGNGQGSLTMLGKSQTSSSVLWGYRHVRLHVCAFGYG